MSRLKDIETDARIKLALVTNPHIGGLGIAVETVNGIVFLSGMVQDPDQKSLAEEIAQSHGGIDVRNDIEVVGTHEQAGGIIRGVLGGGTSPEDTIIRDRVIGALECDNRVSAYMINVEAADGVVRLSGLQDTVEGKQRAGEIARRVDAVSQVRNDIEVRTPS